jgi:hypothetical protein
LDSQKVIIFGGAVNTVDQPAPGDSLYVLNLNGFEWYIPKSSGKTPNSRAHHKANVIGKYMVISFGKYNINIIFAYLNNLNFF